MNDYWKDFPVIEAGLDAVSRRMREVLSTSAFPLAESVERIVSANGKMLRPALILLGGRLGRRRRDLTDLAAAVELLHVATLIHDDVIDEARTRRGVPTVHAEHGVKGAVLAGDWLFSRCFRLASESSSPENARRLAALIGALCAEEIHQDLERYLWPRSERNYLRKIAGKTAALMALSLRVGAVETRATAAVIASLTRVGWASGMAFQIVDDVLDYEAVGASLRKPAATDFREGLCTLPLILALEGSPGRLEPLLGPSRPSEETVLSVVAEVRASGALEAARARARAYTERALIEIDGLPSCSARDELRAIVSRLASRST